MERTRTGLPAAIALILRAVFFRCALTIGLKLVASASAAGIQPLEFLASRLATLLRRVASYLRAFGVTSVVPDLRPRLRLADLLFNESPRVPVE